MADDQNAVRRNTVPSVWTVLFFLCITLFYYQGVREILIARNVVQDILPAIIAMLAGPPAALLLVFVFKGRVSMALGAGLCAAGRLLLLLPYVDIYLVAEVLVFLGFPLAFCGFVATVNAAGTRVERRLSLIASAAVGMVLAPMLHLLLRLFEWAAVPGAAWVFAVAGLAAAGIVFARGEGTGTESVSYGTGENETAQSSTPLILLLACIPLHFLFYVFGEPEILAARCSLSYGITACGIALGASLGRLAVSRWQSVEEEWRGR